MTHEIVRLTPAHLDELPLPEGLDRTAYFSKGSAAYCLLADGRPVFAAGIANIQWKRGEAWILPTPYFRENIRVCYRSIREILPYTALLYEFRRVQATCFEGASKSLFRNLGFRYEGTLCSFGPKGETCDLYCRLFEVSA